MPARRQRARSSPISSISACARLGRARTRRPFGRRQVRRDVGRRVAAAQQMAQGVRIGDRAPDHALAQHRGVRLAAVIARVIDQAQALAREIPAAQHQFAPQFAAFPVAVVGGVVAKAEEDRQRQAHQRKRDDGELDLVVPQLAVGQGDDDRQQRRDRHALPDAGQDRAAHRQEQAQPVRAVAHDHGLTPAACAPACAHPGPGPTGAPPARRRPVC